jgi:GNAT superfamily N-acetyltransferase
MAEVKTESYAGNTVIAITVATAAEIPELERLIAASVMALQTEYTVEQRRAALGTVFGVDRQLIADGTYFCARAGGAPAGCGGWSKRRTPFGGDRSPAKDDALLDPAREAAKIRAFFVHPEWTRRGIGTRLLEACEAAAAAAGFTRVELTSTLAGVALYTARGFTAEEELTVPLANGATLPVLRMSKPLTISLHG